ncbi:hypothetical protein AB7M35_000907 [Amorphus suaedae]
MKPIVFALSILLAGSAFAAAQAESPRKACAADAQKLCASAIPNQQKVLACLEANKPQLSQACQTALQQAGK